ncbi:MAG: hypothetical protein Q9227_001882 [Pyrenula ochraceoflavens]
MVSNQRGRPLYAVLFTVFALILLVYITPSIPSYTKSIPYTSIVSKSHRLEKPKNLKIVAVVFYGRRDRVSILDCYLKRNLVSSGGWLDEVHWAARTDDQDDLEYLEDLVDSSPLYRKTYFGSEATTGAKFKDIYNSIVKPENLYIKMDDDVIYLDDETIPQMVNSLITRPDAVVVSANMINSPEFNWIHYHLGAVRPFLPEHTSKNGTLSSNNNLVWRVSELPLWENTSTIKSSDLDKSQDIVIKDLFTDSGPSEVPFHRWLPLKDATDISHTPIVRGSYDAFGTGWTSWPIAAQQMYSFLQNLEEGQKARYFMNGMSSLWDQGGERYSINLIAFSGEDLLTHIEAIEQGNDDELVISEKFPKLSGRKFFINTRALAVHYAFGTQKEIEKTDLLPRYKAYAIENMCPEQAFLEPLN